LLVAGFFCLRESVLNYDNIKITQDYLIDSNPTDVDECKFKNSII